MESTGIMNGNYLQDKEGKIYCINIDHEGIEGIGVDHNQIEYIFELEPIPLTEEWLLKCALNEPKGIHNDNFSGLVSVGMLHDGCVFYIGNTEVTYIKHVHQLQNLYFALTQKELAIK